MTTLFFEQNKEISLARLKNTKPFYFYYTVHATLTQNRFGKFNYCFFVAKFALWVAFFTLWVAV